LEFQHDFGFQRKWSCQKFHKLYIIQLMSRHPSFKPPGGIAVKRNVLKRFERVELLRKRGQWKEGDRVVSLVKTKPEE
jgi:small basic protein (TIGR04137 family)